jgi:hypothetical protein
MQLLTTRTHINMHKAPACSVGCFTAAAAATAALNANVTEPHQLCFHKNVCADHMKGEEMHAKVCTAAA